MKTQLALRVALLLVLGVLAAQHSNATDLQYLTASSSLNPDSDRSHPDSRQLAIVVPKSITLVYCELSYSHRRREFDPTVPGNPKHIGLSKGGSLDVAFEILRKSEIIPIGSKKVGIKKDSGDREAWVGWTDNSGIEDWGERWETSSSFPLAVRKGDVVLFPLTFQGMPRLKRSWVDEGIQFWDEVRLWANCATCGSNDHPCPEF